MILGAAACDSIQISIDPLPPGASKVAQVEAWYDKAFIQTQERALGKFNNAEVLEAMVAKYPPDWSQAVTLGLGDGITRVTTVLGPGQPATTHSPGELGAVRTISVDINPQDEVVGSRLLEFVSPDSLDPDRFTGYVRQW